MSAQLRSYRCAVGCCSPLSHRPIKSVDAFACSASALSRVPSFLLCFSCFVFFTHDSSSVPSPFFRSVRFIFLVLAPSSFPSSSYFFAALSCSSFSSTALFLSGFYCSNAILVYFVLADFSFLEGIGSCFIGGSCCSLSPARLAPFVSYIFLFVWSVLVVAKIRCYAFVNLSLFYRSLSFGFGFLCFVLLIWYSFLYYFSWFVFFGVSCSSVLVHAGTNFSYICFSLCSVVMLRIGFSEFSFLYI